MSVPTEAVTTKALSASHLAFRDEVRAMLAAELTAEMRQAAANTTTVFADRNLALAWQAISRLGRRRLARRLWWHWLGYYPAAYLRPGMYSCRCP